jgi:hypothetical protein
MSSARCPDCGGELANGLCPRSLVKLGIDGVALAAVEQADPAGDPKTRDQLLGLHREIRAGLDAARRDMALLDWLVAIRSAEADDPDGSGTEAAYADAFHAAARFWAEALDADPSSATIARPDSAITPPAPLRWPPPVRVRTIRRLMMPPGRSSGSGRWVG